MVNFTPSIIVHGGAGPIKDDSLEPRLAGCEKAALVGWQIIAHGGAALDAVEVAVVVLEDDPLFNAGTGSTLNSLGKVEMDAAIMEGQSLRAGAVAAVSGIKNPIKLARQIMEDGRHVMLAGDGALIFARQIGFAEVSSESLTSERERNRWQNAHGTVGCVAFDREGKLAVATSTVMPQMGSIACAGGGICVVTVSDPIGVSTNVTSNSVRSFPPTSSGRSVTSWPPSVIDFSVG